ncbi:CAP domain-containing protein [Nannocystis pusilla]|uniref:CAP domain-containing protein n=1 Tax=Nannocystis pusilla TaxID=889268 RepID=A0A9X3F137_9BACT|nr:CAP domain-containing protein [Nannocystis pusilla]
MAASASRPCRRSPPRPSSLRRPQPLQGHGRQQLLQPHRLERLDLLPADHRRRVRKAAGENIAAGYSTAAQVVNGWMTSTGHCNNIMNGNYKHLGVGYYRPRAPPTSITGRRTSARTEPGPAPRASSSARRIGGAPRRFAAAPQPTSSSIVKS